MSAAPPPFEAVRIPTLLVLGEDSYVTYDHLLDAHRAALGDLLEVVTVPGGHTVLWDALEETGAAIAAFLAGGEARRRPADAGRRLRGVLRSSTPLTRRTRRRSRATSSRIATPSSASSRVIVSGGTTMITFQWVIR